MIAILFISFLVLFSGCGSGGAKNNKSIVSKSGNLHFVGENGYDYISSYVINNGMLKYTGHSTPYESSAAGKVFLAVDPAGRYLFGSENNPGNIISYSIGNNGTLTKLSETAVGYGQKDILNNPNWEIFKNI